jgi:hypothetical protein
VRVGSVGAAVELRGGASGDVEYVAFVWRSSMSFDQFSQTVPRVEGVEELIIRSGVSGGARVASRGGGVEARLGLMASSTSSTATRVWHASLGEGTYSLDGLHVRFARQDVYGVSLTSSSEGEPIFEGWGSVTIHFGKAVDTGSVSISASSALEAVSGESLSVSSTSVSVSAGEDVGVSGGGAVSVSGGSLSVLSSTTVNVAVRRSLWTVCRAWT